MPLIMKHATNNDILHSYCKTSGTHLHYNTITTIVYVYIINTPITYIMMK